MTRAWLHDFFVWHVIYRHKCMHMNVYIHNTTKCAHTHTHTHNFCSNYQCVCAQLLSRVQLFVVPWTVAPRLLRPWGLPGENTGVGCHFLLQGVSPTQGSNPRLLHWRAGSLSLSHLRPKPKTQNNDFQFCPFLAKHKTKQ